MSDIQYRVTWTSVDATDTSTILFLDLESLGRFLGNNKSVIIKKAVAELKVPQLKSTSEILKEADLEYKYIQRQRVRNDIRADLEQAQQEVKKLRTKLSIESRRKIS